VAGVASTKAAAWQKQESGDQFCEYEQDLNYTAINGKRMKAAQQLFEDGQSLLTVLVLNILDECMRFYTQWNFVVGRRQKDTRTCPPLLDLVNEEWSPVLVCRQYLSGILTGFLRCVGWVLHSTR
jgi:hypothetical protein